jgi:uncharacterized protein YhdP
VPLPQRTNLRTSLRQAWLLAPRWRAWLVSSVAAVVLLAAVIGLALQFLLLPRIDALRPLLMQHLSQSLGVQLRMDSMVADTRSSWLPRFELRGLRVLDAQASEVFRLDSISVQLSPWALMQGRVTHLAQLTLNAPQLTLRRDKQGQLWVAGVAIKNTGADPYAATDWLLSQSQVNVRQGRLRWRDETGQTPPFELNDFELTLRNAGQRHQLNATATPPAAWVATQHPVQLQLQLHSPADAAHVGDWRQWRGQGQASVRELNLAAPAPHVRALMQAAAFSMPLPPAPQWPQGLGSASLSIDFEQAQLSAARLVLDVPQLHHVQALAQALAPTLLLPPDLQLQALKGQFALTLNPAATSTAAGFDLKIEAFGFHSKAIGLWPSSRLQFTQSPVQSPPTTQHAQHTHRLDVAGLDLGTLSKALTLALPSPQARHWMQALALQGQAAQLQLHWLGAGTLAEQVSAWQQSKGQILLAPATQLQAQGRVQQLGFAAQTTPLLRPGLHGLDVNFEVNHDGGKLRVQTAASKPASLDLPGVLAGQVLPLQHLNAQLRWQHSAASGLQSLEAEKLQFANADVQGSSRFVWRQNASTKDASALDGREGQKPVQAIANFEQVGRRGQLGHLGHLDLQADVQHLVLNRLHHYLPQSLAPEVQAYVRSALQEGLAERLSVKLRGSLSDFPFAKAHQKQLNAGKPPTPPPPAGDAPVFELRAQLRQAQLGYASAWPALTQMDGDLVLRGTELTLSQVNAQVLGSPSWRLQQSQAQIADLRTPQLHLALTGAGDVGDLLRFVQHSPLAGGAASETANSLAHIRAEGESQLQLVLNLPLQHLEDTTLNGQLNLLGNQVQLHPDAPEITALKASLGFTQADFLIHAAQAEWLGGAFTLAGGSKLETLPGQSAPERVIDLLAQGRTTAQGWQALAAHGAASPTLARMARMGQRMSGGNPMPPCRRSCACKVVACPSWPCAAICKAWGFVCLRLLTKRRTPHCRCACKANGCRPCAVRATPTPMQTPTQVPR